MTALQVVSFDTICFDLPLYRMNQRRIKGFLAQKRQFLLKYKQGYLTIKQFFCSKEIEARWKRT